MEQKYLHDIPLIPPILNVTANLEHLLVTTQEFSSHVNTVQRHVTDQTKGQTRLPEEETEEWKSAEENFGRSKILKWQTSSFE